MVSEAANFGGKNFYDQPLTTIGKILRFVDRVGCLTCRVASV